MGDQKEKIAHLDQVTIKQYDQLIQCRDLIKAQREYIDLLEVNYFNPFHRRAPSNKDPI